MRLIVPDAYLDASLRIRTKMDDVWPGAAAQEVMMLVSVLQHSVSLADAMAVGLVKAMAPTSTRTDRLSVSHGSAVLTGKARSAADRRVLDPWSRPEEVVSITVVDVAAGGRSGLRAAG